MKKLAVAIVFLSLAALPAWAQTPWVGLSLGAGSFGGAKVKSVIPGSPGERAGIKAGDEVLSIDEKATAGPQEVIAAVQSAGVGHAAKLRLVDGKGHTRTVALTFEARPD